MPKNVAAWALKPKTRPLTVSSAPYTTSPKGHVVIAVEDVAINPIDHILQSEDIFHMDYPTIFGYDVAGTIKEVGEDVTDFKVGARVIANTSSGNISGVPKSAFGGFQKYALVNAHAVAELPSNIRTSVGVVLPLSISTASAGLFQEGFLALPFPSEDPEHLGRTILVWGGSSSVGSSAIQLAVAAGAQVIATASANNFDYCKRLGAAEVFDYHDDDVEDQIVKYLEGKTVAGAFHAVGADGAAQAAARILDRSKGKTILVTVKGVPEDGIPISVRVRANSQRDVIFTNKVGPKIWRDFLPKALKSGTIRPQPDPKIVGEELRSVQLGLDTLRKGVSAEKVVVSYIS